MADVVDPKPIRTTTRVRGTEIVATDSAQQYRQKLARIALDEMCQFVALLDAEGTLLEVNRAALEGVGLTLSDVEGKPFWKTFWWGVSEEIQEALRGAISRAAGGEFIRYDVEIYGRANGKETIIIDFSMIPVKDESGKVVFIVPEGRDVTEKKAQERSIAEANVTLRGLLERVRELDEIKTQFFANVSHELRTPLALIIGPAERLLRDDSMGVAQRRESANVIARNAKLLLKHVNDLLDISKLEAGKLKIALHDTDVASLVRLTASHFVVLADERRIEFLVDAPQQAWCAIDCEKFQRIAMNLLSNGFKFAPDGGAIRCTLQVSKGDLVFSVEDSGPGVKPELRKAVFERFRQGEGGANRQYGGTGLGLAIAREFVEMHKGTLQVLDSDLGGALFRVTLPDHRLSSSSPECSTVTPALLDRGAVEGFIEELRPASAISSVRHVDETSEPGVLKTNPKTRVLVVEDSIEMNHFISQCLSEHYHVISAFDGQDGLQKALAFSPTLIITDIMMPRLDGAQMIAEIRQRPEFAGTPILLLSAKADDELKARLLEEGAQDFVIKPFSEQELLVRARNLISTKQGQDALMEANRRKDEFLAMLGHEMRNPLAPIVTALELMRLRDGDRNEKERSIIERQVTHLVRLVDDLLDVSRIASGKIELKLQWMELADVVAKAIESVSPLLEQRRHQLAVTVPRHGLAVHGDLARLSQVVSNLLANAAKYTEPGGLITILAERVAENIELRIRDTGIGIAPEMLPTVFDLFTQEAQSLARSQGGLGLGLAIVRNLVTLHGGTVTAQSAGLARGSEFTTRLPAAALQLASPLVITPSRASPLANEHAVQGLHVLVVDDNEDAADLLAEVLGVWGHTVRVAHEALSALRLVSEFTPEIALLDIGLPVMDGYELALLLKQNPDLQQTRLVALTGYGQDSDRQRSKAAGFDMHLVKPIDITALRKLITGWFPPGGSGLAATSPPSSPVAGITHAGVGAPMIDVDPEPGVAV